MEAFYRYPNGWIHSYCRKCHSKRGQQYAKKNPEKRRQYLRRVSQHTKNTRLEWRRKQRLAVIEMMGGKCVCCGFSDPRALQIDHVKGGGHAERLKFGSVTKLYGKLLRGGTDGYQLLCANCNWIKRYENNEYRTNYRVTA